MTPEQIAIDALLSAGTERQARRILAALGTRSALAHLERRIAYRKARELLASRTPRPDIVRHLVARYGLSRRSAYRLIGEALREPLRADPAG